VTEQSPYPAEPLLDDSIELGIALRLLADGVPLTLLLDLAGPLRSRDLYREEAGNADWLVTAGVA
jgi:hypothetical protein